YLPRLAREDVLLDAIREGIRSKDFFAYANGQDAQGKYLGLTWNSHDVRVLMDSRSLLVKREVAAGLIEPSGGIEGGGTAAREPAVGEPGRVSSGTLGES